MLVDVDWVLRVFMTDMSLLINGYLRWQLKHTSGWIEAPGYSRIACLGTWVDQDCLFFLWTATQAQRDHEIIHTRNFHVQPQAIMGSSIVD